MSYTKEIYINVSIGSTRIAILENSVLVELYIDIADHKRMVGNIYKGKIQNVIPGMQAAFIDIGQSINAFLPFTEIGEYDVLNNEPFSIEQIDKKNTSDKKINMIDTPGYLDFHGDVKCALRVSDCVLNVISASDGVLVGNDIIFDYANKEFNVPMMIDINMCDRDQSNFDSVLNKLKVLLSNSNPG